MKKKVIETLVTELVADGAKMKKEMADSLKNAKTWGDKFKSITSKIAIGAGVGAAGLGAGVIALTKSAIDNADAMSKQSQSVGMALETLSAYSYAAEMGGVENDKFGASLIKFNRVVDDAFQGLGKGVDAFDTLNISLTDSNGKLKNNSELFAEVADRFRYLPDGIQKTALATDLFGKSGADLIPVLNGGKQSLMEMTDEAKRLGLVISTETGKDAELFNDNIEKMQKSLQGLGLKIAEESLPALNEFTNKINDPKNQQGLGDLASGIITLAGWVVDGAAKLADFTGKVGEFFAKSFHGIDVLNLKELEGEIQDIRDVLESPLTSPFDPTIPRRLLFMSSEELQAELKKLVQIRDDINKGMFGKGSGFNVEPSSPVADPFLDSADSLNYDQWQAMEDNRVKTMEEIRANELSENKKLLQQKYEQENEISMKMALDKENREIEQQKQNEREVEMQRDKFKRIHEEMLSARGLERELEIYRYEQEKADFEAEYELMKKSLDDKKLLEQDYLDAQMEMEVAHQARLQEIKKRAEDEERNRKEEGYAHLIGLAETYNNAKGRFTNKYTAVALGALKLLADKEKREAIKSVAREGYVSIQKAWASAPFPANVGPVVLATAAAAGNLVGVTGVAHGGLDNVPKESTYLLDKGERVLSPNQNQDLTNFLQNSGDKKLTVNVINQNTGATVDVRETANGIDVIVRKVVDTIKDGIARGNGIDSTLRAVYPQLIRRGS
jgi:hypothetical protein